MSEAQERDYRPDILHVAPYLAAAIPDDWDGGRVEAVLGLLLAGMIVSQSPNRAVLRARLEQVHENLGAAVAEQADQKWRDHGQNE